MREEVSVAPDKQERKTDPRGDAFSTVLTPAQIAQLPDDPDEMEQVLQQMAGPGATIRVRHLLRVGDHRQLQHLRRERERRE